MSTDHDTAARWRIPPRERIALGKIDTSSTAGAPGGADATKQVTAMLLAKTQKIHERLRAEQKRSLLVVLQGMDTGGKDGTIKHVFSGLNPEGLEVAYFKEPTYEDLAHDFLWRVHRRAPERGHIGIFNRSHYEDVLVVRVHNLVPENVWRPRYEAIRDFERTVTDEGTRIVKLMLHISKQEQARRLRERLADPEKRWKFDLNDVKERARWADYMTAYEDAIAETSTDEAPWYVIPADAKWYRNWAVTTIIAETLRDMNPAFPTPPDLSGVVIPDD